MSKTRMVQTKIWSDDWFLELGTEAKLLYIFLLTNKVTQISGYYELGLREMEFFTGIKVEKVKKLLPILEPKITYYDGWVIIKNYPKYQNVANNQKVQTLIENLLKEVPSNILNLNHKSKSKSEAIDSLSIGYQDTAQNIDPVDKDVGNNEDKLKKKYGEFKNVLLTDTEKEKLKSKYGRDVAMGLVEELSVGIESKGYKYKSHYATIISWARKKGVQALNTGSVPKLIPEIQQNGTVRLIANPDYHD